MNDVPTNGKVEITVRRAELEHALVLERQPGSDVCMAGTCQLQVGINDIDPEHMGSRKELG